MNNGLINAISASKLYQNSNSPYQADAQKVITCLYNKHNNAGQVEELENVCKEQELDLNFK